MDKRRPEGRMKGTRLSLLDEMRKQKEREHTVASEHQSALMT